MNKQGRVTMFEVLKEFKSMGAKWYQLVGEFFKLLKPSYKDSWLCDIEDMRNPEEEWQDD